MTGFGVGEARVGAVRVSVEARSVNHRFLDVHLRLPRELTDQVVHIEQLLRRRLSRGRLDVAAHLDGALGGGVTLDRARALTAIDALRALAREVGAREEVPLSLLATVPELFVPASSADREPLRAALVDAVTRCVADLERSRATEGEQLAEDLRRRVGHLRREASTLATRAGEMPSRQRERLRERVARLVEDPALRPDGARLEQEIALLALHCDVAEELTRFAAHVDQFERLIDVEEPVGRRMDFLLQEMSREVNTVGAKAIDAEVTRCVVELKAELERMREQVQNVE